MIYFIGAGPGATDLITVRGMRLLQKADVVIYAGSLVNPELLDDCRPETTIYNSASMTLEQTVAAMRDAPEGATVVRLHTGDPCLYGAIAEQMRELDKLGLAYEVVPGVSSFCGAAAVLGSPLCGDFAVVSLSDQLTPWATIERRLRAAAAGGFPIALYNPCSRHRPDHLARACAILMETLPASTVCGYVQNIGRDGQKSRVLTLGELVHEPLDMFTTVLIGNAETQERFGRMLTPRGYRL